MLKRISLWYQTTDLAAIHPLSRLPRSCGMRSSGRRLTWLNELWCKHQDAIPYGGRRAGGGVAMGKLMGVEQLFEGRHFDREVHRSSRSGKREFGLQKR
jgi:hypothetical protein